MTLERALGILAKACAEAETIGVAMSFAVVDAAGNLVALTRMDGASFLTADTARSKAWTAAASRIPTSALAKALEAGMSAGAASLITSTSISTGGRFMAASGGLPIVDGGEIVGAIGASGGSGEQDVAAAEAAIA